MGQLIYSMLTALDGRVAVVGEGEPGDGDGNADEELHAFIDEHYRGVGTYLYGRRTYETMAFWETAHALPDAPQAMVDFARGWQSARKLVFSTTLEDVVSERTSLERSFDPVAVERLKAEADHDLTVNGPTLAAEAVRAGLVDEYHLFLTPDAGAGGAQFWPVDVRLRLALVEHRAFGNGVVFLRYRPR
ncbi:dihydrofolate reductase family protein [Nocardioides flavescens]|uniref:Deaminase n=1 Tax=Nocardioides flavescens TaxID=2691959 RepID=A0A6L7F2L2_9ACTN|nr:deaminase [Nocardioides flavescens]